MVQPGVAVRTEDATLGFKVHHGWATAIAVGPGPTLLLRSRLDGLVDPRIPESYGPYHQGKGMTAERLRELIEHGSAGARAAARRRIGDLLAEMRPSGVTITRAAVIRASGVSADLIRHPQARIHQGDVDVYRDAVAWALEEHGVHCLEVVQGRLRAEVEADLGIPTDSVDALLAQLGRAAGKPWRAEEKQATLAALMASARSR